MVKSGAKTVDAYLKALEPERRRAVETVRRLILENLPEGYVETLAYGIIGYVVPLERFPDTYNGQPLCYAAIASQKNYISLYLMSVYGNPEIQQWFKDRYAASGKQLAMGKSCLRFKTPDEIPLDLIAETIARVPLEAYLRAYEESRRNTAAGKRREGNRKARS